MKIDLGDEVRDSISGFKGIVTGVHVYLYGCTGFTVCEKKTAKELNFDEPALILLKKKKTHKTIMEKIKEPYTGGPDKHIDTRVGELR